MTRFRRELRLAEQRLAARDRQHLESTEYGVVEFAEQGEGADLLVCHPIFGGFAFSVDPITANRPTISGFTPTSGVPGDTVTISGSHFSGATNVTFDLRDATFTVDSDSQITATVPAGATTGDIEVITPNGGAVSADKFTVANADFTLSVTPTSQIVTAGAGTSYTIGVWPNSNLTGNIDLSLSGLPAGATATFTPAATANSSTLTIQTSHKSLGNSTLTITGRNSTFVHTATIALQVFKK